MSSIRIACRPADNPFASHRVEGLPFRQNGLSRESLLRRLVELGGWAAIVGPEGSGKTTLLEELACVLSADPVLVRYSGDCRHPSRTARAQLPNPVTSSHAVLLDGVEQLGPFGLRRLFFAVRDASFVIATLHRPRVLPTLIECRPDPSLLVELVEELAPNEAPALGPGLDHLFKRHDGNIRLCFRELYDVYAGRSNSF